MNVIIRRDSKEHKEIRKREEMPDVRCKMVGEWRMKTFFVTK
jgi:hypothetical protein